MEVLNKKLVVELDKRDVAALHAAIYYICNSEDSVLHSHVDYDALQAFFEVLDL